MLLPFGVALCLISFASCEMSACFVPNGTPSCLSLVLDLIDGARNYIRIMSYSYTLPVITKTLCDAVSRNVDCEILIDRGASKSKKAVRELKSFVACGGRVYVDNSSVPIAHNKIMMIDNTTLTTGSVNWSANGFFKNAENMLIVKKDPIFFVYMDNFLYRSKTRVPFR